MKKQLVIASLALGAIVFTTNNVKAQDIAKTSTKVEINLAEVISIDPGSVAIGGRVDFNYKTAADYNTVSNAVVPNSLIVTSSKSFNIDVKADGENFENGEALIPVDVLTIKPVKGGTTTMTGDQQKVVLSTKPQTLIQGADLGSAVTLELDYEIPAAKSSSSDILGKPAGTYTQTITYTATAN